MAGLCLSSCKKTEYEYQKRPYNDIKVFTVLNATGDSTKCFISGDSITVNWSPDVALPATITPKIVIDGKATISPASGTAVPFNKTTVYTVTAENGDIKTYKLNPLVGLPTPIISSASGPITWLTTNQMTIFGEYFLSGTDASQLQAYLQRVSDGVEIPLTVDRASITNYGMRATLPDFSAEQDTGMHKLYVKAGNRIAKSFDVRFITPPITNITQSSNLVQDGQPIHSGDKITINYTMSDNYGGKVASYYHARNIDHIRLYFSKTFEIVEIRDGIVKGDNTVEITLPNLDKYKGEYMTQYRFIYKSAPPAEALFSSYYLRGFLSTTGTIVQ
ncbi:hypothetical protein GCM10023149_23460 [Mucilaginibacter gynuensis]|uniref:DUF5018 domain-containing protein n=1 Tax=Mucilaginibacter gynuensis TaxID=1302236 RepID=A0ABP8GEH2_9SPHI